MKFYDRENELAELKRIQNLSFTDHSRLTVVTGRRRIGKTSLVMRAVKDSPTVYLFVSRKSEASLCAEYVPLIAQSLDVYVPEDIKSFRSLFQYLLEQAKVKTFNLVIDEFQEFYNINPSVYSDMQNLWDRYRMETHLNLIVSGSVYSLMQRIFRSSKEPLFGRADNIIKLSAFCIATLKEIMHDYNPDYTPDDLLALYSFTGGVPKYVELFCDNRILDVEGMISFMIRDNSPFLDEGKYLLIEEFGKNYATYFSILSAISGGINTQSSIESALGEKSIGGQLKRLMEDYNVITRRRPILAKEGSQTIRYEITDNFLRFSGHLLELYFKQQMAETFQYRDIGSWWELKNGQNEIDIVALKLEKNKAVAIEVKRQKKNFKPELFRQKVEHLKKKVLPQHEIEMKCLSLEDM